MPHQNRLTVTGSRALLQRFQKSAWLEYFSGRFAELLEIASTRFACQFETSTLPIPALTDLSRKHPGLIFLLDYETEQTKGLVTAKDGVIFHSCVRY